MSKSKLPSKSRVFYLHFNRIAMQRGDPKVWSIRTSRGCYHAAEVQCTVPVETVFKADARSNPRAFLRGVGVVRISPRGYRISIGGG